MFTLAARKASSPIASISLLALAASLLGGCSFSSSGPSARRVNSAAGQEFANANILVVDVSDAVARRVIEADRQEGFAGALGEVPPVGTVVGQGDVLDIAIWESPPAALFGAVTGGTSELMQAANQTARGTSLPEQMVDSDGRVTVPFVGSLRAAGRTPQQIAKEVMGRLHGIAHEPQVVVRVVRNATKTVTVVGDVANSARVPLTAKGERLLDVLAAAGGVKQSVTKTMVQVTRGPRVVSQPLQTIVTDPRENVRLQPDDVVTVYFQPYSFTALGAMGGNAEIAFEATGITLAQALGRVGGLNDQRANAQGVFLYRLENPAAVDPALAANARTTPDGRIPVIYHVDLKDPAAFFVAQTFAMRNHDILYVANSGMAELQKFVNIVSSVVIPAITVQNSTR